MGPLAKESFCAVTTGLLVLRPAAAEFARAEAHMKSLNYSEQRYDGGDEEFWSATAPRE